MMEKLTQFVSKSFENNNNRVLRPTVQNLVNIKNDENSIPDKIADQEDIETQKTEDEISIAEEVTTKQPKPAKNWLISNSPKPQNICTSYGMDLRVNPNGYPIILGSAAQPICDIAPSYPETKCDSDDNKDKIKWLNQDVKQPLSSPRNCCCPTSNDQEDSIESNYDSIARTKILSDNNSSSYGIEDDKNHGEFKIYSN